MDIAHINSPCLADFWPRSPLKGFIDEQSRVKSLNENKLILRRLAILSLWVSFRLLLDKGGARAGAQEKRSFEEFAGLGITSRNCDRFADLKYLTA